MSRDEKRPLGKILLQRKLVSQQELDASLQSDRTAPLASRLVDEGKVDEVDALRALSEQSGVPGIDLGQVAIRLDHLDVVPRELAQNNRILPVLVRGDRIFLAMADPREKRMIDELEFVTGKKVYAYIAVHSTLERAIAGAYDAKARGEHYYLGPRVPDETLRQLGLSRGRREGALPPPPPPSGPGASPPSPSPGSAAQGPNAGAPPAPGPTAASPAKGPPDLPPTRSAAQGAQSGVRPQSPAHVPTDKTAASEARSTIDEPPKPPVVVDEAIEHLAERSEVSTSEFGVVDGEISSAAHLPEDLRHRAARAATAATGTGRLLLVVDDDEEIRKLLRRLFSQKGHRVLEADRGLLALRLVKDHVPDLIVLDAMLPELHGFDIARRIKGSAKYGNIPIVMMSAIYRGWRIAEDLKQNYGIEEYLEKPFRISDVLEIVQRLLALGDRASNTEQRDPEYLSAEAERALREGVDAYKAGQLDRAVEHLERGVSIDPLAYRLRFHLGLLYGKRGQVYEGIQELERAVDLNPRHFAALKNLAVLYEKAGFKNKAVEMWERSAATAPDDATRASIREHLHQLI